MESFGCCSSYEKCSDNRKCLHEGNPEYAGCKYKKNLEAGRIFYGKNAAKTQHIQKQQPKNIYLACFQNLFAVHKRRKDTWSQLLNATEVKHLSDVFLSLKIPFRTELDFVNIDGVIYEDDSPCNSRVKVTIDEQEYNIFRHDIMMIKPVYADLIAKALNAKGLKSTVELVG